MPEETHNKEQMTMLIAVPPELMEAAVAALDDAGLDLDPARDLICPGRSAAASGIFTSGQLQQAVTAVNERLADSNEIIRLSYKPENASVREMILLLKFLRDHVSWSSDEEIRAQNVNVWELERFRNRNQNLATFTATPWATEP